MLCSLDQVKPAHGVNEYCNSEHGGRKEGTEFAKALDEVLIVQVPLRVMLIMSVSIVETILLYCEINKFESDSRNYSKHDEHEATDRVVVPREPLCRVSAPIALAVLIDEVGKGDDRDTL